MSNPVEIYVISNSDLFREGLNAIAAFCNSSAFKSASYIGALIGVVMTAIAYLKQHDMMVFVKWLVSYTLVFNVLLGVTQEVNIINTSDPSVPGQLVDNVPIGVSLPAHLITMIGQGFGSDLETAFHMPNSLQYNKTGMLFGSNLFRLSLATHLEDPDTLAEMNSYVRSCVVGDITINHDKYTLKELLNSHNLWNLMKSKPSQIRGIFYGGNFMTCKQAADDLDKKIDNYSKTLAPSFLAKRIPSHRIYANAAINTMLQDSYFSLTKQSIAANDILKQNIAINAFRSGIENYALETGSIAALDNFANTQAMMNTRMAWATSSHMGVETLPLMQVVLLLMMVCVFPLIAILAMIPGFGATVLKNYIYTLIWLESWPVMFTVLNLAMTYYACLGGNQEHFVTLSNINRLAQEHSDIAGIAGYLVLAIPFLSIGLVKGMASTFNQAAQYIGGMMHSIGQSASSAVAMGNYNFGNVSTANATANTLHANKHDTNFMNMHGMATEQLANGSTIMNTASGSVVSQVGGAISKLATSVNASSGISASLTRSAEHYRASAETHRQAADHSIQSAVTNASAYDSVTGKSDAMSNTYSTGVNSQIDHSVTSMMSHAREYAKRNDLTETEAFRKLTQDSLHESVGVDSGKSALGKIAQFTVGASGKVSNESIQQAQSNHDVSYQQGNSQSLNDRDVSEFRKNMHVVENYAATHAASDSHSQTEQLAIKMGNDFRQAESSVQSYQADLTNSEKLSQQAAFVSTHGESIQTNFDQSFAAYVRQVDPEHANALLNNTTSVGIAMQRKVLAQNYMHQYAKQFENEYLSESSQVNPSQRYKETGSKIQANASHLRSHYEENQQQIIQKSKDKEASFDRGSYNSLQHSVLQHADKVTSDIREGEINEKNKEQTEDRGIHQSIENKKERAQDGLLKHAVTFYD